MRVRIRLHAAFGDDPQVEAWPPVGDHQRGHLGLAQAHADPEAGDAGLGDLELGLPDAIAVADADLVVRQPVDGEVLAELAVLQIVAAQVLSPVLVGLPLIDQHRANFTAVTGQIALPVAVDVEPPDHARAVDRMLEDPGVDGSALPGHVLRLPDIQGQQARHRNGLLYCAAAERVRW